MYDASSSIGRFGPGRSAGTMPRRAAAGLVAVALAGLLRRPIQVAGLVFR
jgi:hypothetical protein